MRILIATVLALGLVAATIGTTEAACRPVFVAGEGVIDSCTGRHRSPYPDPPPQPPVTELWVSVLSPHIYVVNNVEAVPSWTSMSSAIAVPGLVAPAPVVGPRVVNLPPCRQLAPGVGVCAAGAKQ